MHGRLNIQEIRSGIRISASRFIQGSPWFVPYANIDTALSSDEFLSKVLVCSERKGTRAESM